MTAFPQDNAAGTLLPLHIAVNLLERLSKPLSVEPPGAPDLDLNLRVPYPRCVSVGLFPYECFAFARFAREASLGLTGDRTTGRFIGRGFAASRSDRLTFAGTTYGGLAASIPASRIPAGWVPCLKRFYRGLRHSTSLSANVICVTQAPPEPLAQPCTELAF